MLDRKTCLADPKVNPARWGVKRIIKEIRDYPGLSFLLEGKTVEGNLDLSGSLPEGLKVEGNLNLEGCTGLKHIPDDLKKDWIPFKKIKKYII